MGSRLRHWTLPLMASACLHLTLAIALTLITSIAMPQSRSQATRSIAVMVPAADASDAAPSDQPLIADPADRDEVVDRTSSPSRANQDFDFEKLRARREGLFPFLTTNMDFLERVNDELSGAPTALAIPFALTPNRSPKLTPLQLTQSELQGIVDRAWSRRSRWTAFSETARLLRTHDPDRGQAPAVLRAYLDQNLLQLFCDAGSRAPRMWTMLENAADHLDFIEFVGEFTREHPASAVTTELLFLLDKLAQANRDALLLLVNVDPAQELTIDSPRDAVEFAVALQAHYGERLEYRQLHSPADIEAWYDMVRLRILSTVIATSPNGYRVADARFLAGAIHFERGDTPEVIESWRAIQADSRDGYVDEYSRLLDELQWPGGVREKQIRYVVDSVHSRWRAASLERLRHFGSTCESY